MMKKRPIILHTDLGTDIDDSWALIMLLRQPFWDLKLVLADTGTPSLRAAHIAAILKACDRADIPIGLGMKTEQSHPMTFQETLSGTELTQYPGGIFPDGPGKLIELVEASAEPVSLVSIGPAPALENALQRAPEIAGKIRFSGMFGSVNCSFDRKPGRIAEYNIVQNISAAKALFAAPWLDGSITPLDSCGCIRLEGDLFRAIRNSKDPALRLLMAQNDAREKFLGHSVPPAASSILFDTVAVHLASSTEFLRMEDLRLTVDERGFLREAPEAPVIHYALDWTDLPGYQKFLTKLLLN